jgi:hypothetical protein
MSFIVRRKTDYALASEGNHVAVIAGVEDLGVVSTAYGDKHMARISFQLEERTPKGDRHVGASV